MSSSAGSGFYGGRAKSDVLSLEQKVSQTKRYKEFQFLPFCIKQGLLHPRKM